MKYAWQLWLVLYCGAFLQASEVVLFDQQGPTCDIVVESTLNPVDAFALEELKDHLGRMTDRSFPVVHQVRSGRKHIFLGLSAAARRHLGGENRFQALQEQDAVIQVKDGHLFLYGKGKHGNLYAVYEFLENVLGCRWLSAYEDAYIPKRSKIVLKPGVRVRSQVIPKRSIMFYFYADKEKAGLFLYRNRQNLGLPPDWVDNPALVQAVEKSIPTCHSLNRLLPGCKIGVKAPADWLTCKDYFAKHPEWFSMDESGKRVNTRQVCFANRELRKELTHNALIDYQRRIKDERDDFPEGGYLTIDLNDVAYAMCNCPACIQMKHHYGTPGGPLFDYLFALCKHYPDIPFATLAYQRRLTQHPPRNCNAKIPNLTVLFCPINGAYSDTLDAGNQADYQDLLDWKKIAGEVWVWYYPNTYNHIREKYPVCPPMGNFERLARDIRALQAAKVDGTFFEHDSGGVQLGVNLSEMQSWVMLKLFQNPETNVRKLMEEFAGLYYGKAAQLILTFADELEQERKNTCMRGEPWTYGTQDYSYLTPQNLIRWEHLFDQAEAVAERQEERFHVKLARLGLDCATAYKLTASKETTALAQQAESRMLATLDELEKRRPMGDKIATLRRRIAQMEHLLPEKPLPAELLAKYSAEQIEILHPGQNIPQQYKVQDREASRGNAVVESWDGKSFPMGCYDYGTKQHGPVQVTIPASSVTWNKYALYDFKKVFCLTPDLSMWGGTWKMSLPLGKHCRRDVTDSLLQKWKLYVSLKFTKDKVFLDRGFLIRQ